MREYQREKDRIRPPRENTKARREVQDRRKISIRRYVFDILRKSVCVDCGESDPIVLDFDHVRGRKKMAVSGLVSRAASLFTINREIKKCEVRCANCHRRKTAKEQKWLKFMEVKG